MELLVRVRDKINADDFYLNCQLTKRGDVIAIQPDGHEWSHIEQSHPDWRILKIPEMDEETASTFLAPEIDTDPKNPSKTLQKRVFKIDVDNLPVADYIDDDARAAPALLIQDPDAIAQPTRAGAEAPAADPEPTLPYALADLLALKVQKPKIDDPAVFGASPTVF